MGRKYRNPPLALASCDFRLGGGAWTEEAAGAVAEELAPILPVRELLRETDYLTVRVSASATMRVTDSHGLRLSDARSGEESVAAVFSPHVVSVQHKKQGYAWERMLPFVEASLGAYRRHCEPSRLNRLSLEYTNFIDFPIATHRIEDYFEFYPHVGADLPQVLARFTTSIETLAGGGRDVMRIRLGMQPLQAPPVLRFGLVLDCFTGRPEDVGLDGSIEWLCGAHDEIERAFEGAITDATRALFDQE